MWINLDENIFGLKIFSDCNDLIQSAIRLRIAKNLIRSNPIRQSTGFQKIGFVSFYDESFS